MTARRQPQTVPITNVTEERGYRRTVQPQSGAGPDGGQDRGWLTYWEADQRSVGQGQINVDQTERILSALGGAALLAYAIQRRSATVGLIGGALGLGLLYRGVSGYSYAYHALQVSTAKDHVGKGVRVDAALTVNRPIEEVYDFWRNLENLPKFMRHIKAVQRNGSGQSHWIAEISPKLRLEWDAQILQDIPNELIAWRTVPGSTIDHGGAVRFKPATGNRGTEVHATIRYEPPGGMIGETVAGLFKTITQQQVKEDIRRFKSVMEAGEFPSTQGQPRCE